MKKFTIGDMFKHPGYKLARFVFCSFDLGNETFKAFNTVTGQVQDFDFSDFEDCRKVKTDRNDSILA